MRWCTHTVNIVSSQHVGLRLLHASMPTHHSLLSSEPIRHILPSGAILRFPTKSHRSSSAIPTSAVGRGYSKEEEEEEGSVAFRQGRRDEGRGCRWSHVGSTPSWRRTTTATHCKNRQPDNQRSRVVARLSAAGAASGAGTHIGTEPDLAVVVETRSGAMGARVAPPSHPTYDIRTAVKAALAEDFGDKGDLTSLATVPTGTQAEAQFLAKADGVLAGVTLAEMVFEEVDPSLQVTWSLQDGDYVRKGTVFGTVTGEARSILAAERVALNFMQRMSGIATATKEMADLSRPARMLETRKTVPGLRLLDKWAVLIGGGENHRMGLYDMLLIKDNHIAAAGGLKQAVAAATQYIRQHGLAVGVEVETRTLEEVQQVLQCIRDDDAIVTRVMLDNMTVVKDDGSIDVSMLRDAVAMVGGLVETEASGNVTLDTVAAIGATGVTFISSGALTHSVRALDISLNIDTELAVKVGQRTNRA